MLWTDLDRFGLLDPWRPNRATSGFPTPSAGAFPAVNVWEEGDKAFVTAELPGIDPKDVDISVVGKSVTLRGSRKPADVCEGECFHRRERWTGQFGRTIEMPYLIDAGKVEARFTKGVLHITLPRAEAEKPKKIAVKFE